ncbi:MAG: hypothetical protein AABX02_05395, partial [archaeon]
MKHPSWNVLENWRKKRAGERMESECEPFLSFLSVELAMQSHFDRGFHAALTHATGTWREELEHVWRAYVEKGQSLEKGLALIGTKWGRRGISRVTGMLIHLSTAGVSEAGIAGIQQLSKDMRHQHGIALKEYGNKLAVFSLMFIAVSALIPAFLLGFLTVGSRFLELDVDATQIYILACVIFPALDILVLSWGWIQTPAWMHAYVQPEKKSNPVSIQSIFNQWKKTKERIEKNPDSATKLENLISKVKAIKERKLRIETDLIPEILAYTGNEPKESSSQPVYR